MLACVALAAGTACAADGSLARIRSRGTLRWGGDVQGGEPYVFQDPHEGTGLVGFEVEIADGLARRLGVRADFVQNDWQNLIPSLERGDFDIILNGLEVTAARRSRIAFTRPYYAFGETLVVRQDSAVAGLGDLRGALVGTLDGSLARDLLAAAPGVGIVLYEGVEEPYTDLESGRVDAVLLDDVIARRYGLVRPDLRAAATVGAGVYAIAVRSDEPALREALDAALGAMSDDGSLRAILERWGLWNDRQAALAAGAPTVPEASAAHGMTLAQAWLFFRAAGNTVVISALAMALAVAVGLALSVARRYAAPPLRAAATLYVELFRGTPVLLQLYVLYYGLAPVLPLDPFTAAVLGLGLNYAAGRRRPRSRWASRAPRRCAGSCCRRRCGWPSPAWPTTSSRC
jgi:polar amino acid transport system substrate-binding protein